MLFKLILFRTLNSIHVNCVSFLFILFCFVIFMFVFFSRSRLSHFYLELVLYSNLVSYFKSR